MVGMRMVAAGPDYQQETDRFHNFGQMVRAVAPRGSASR
jgi:hypothetical protein